MFQLCDGSVDCFNFEDELHCGGTQTRGAGAPIRTCALDASGREEFMCMPTGECLPSRYCD